MYDGVLCHAVKSVKHYMNEMRMPVKEWPSNSLDFNTIERMDEKEILLACHTTSVPAFARPSKRLKQVYRGTASKNWLNHCHRDPGGVQEQRRLHISKIRIKLFVLNSLSLRYHVIVGMLLAGMVLLPTLYTRHRGVKY